MLPDSKFPPTNMEGGIWASITEENPSLKLVILQTAQI
jgi:hypothetical protein